MNPKLMQILDSIERRLSEPDIVAFKVGKTENPQIRFNAEEYNEYDFAQVIAIGNPSDISNAENDLIGHFDNHSTLRRKSTNRNSGSAGNPNAKQLYIVAQGYCPEDPRDRLLEKSKLLENFIPVIL